MVVPLPRLRPDQLGIHGGIVAVGGTSADPAAPFNCKRRAARVRGGVNGVASEPNLRRLPKVVSEGRPRRNADQLGRTCAWLGKAAGVRQDSNEDHRRPAWWPGYGELRSRRAPSPIGKVVVRNGQRQDLSAAVDRHTGSARAERIVRGGGLEGRLAAAYLDAPVTQDGLPSPPSSRRGHADGITSPPQRRAAPFPSKPSNTTDPCDDVLEPVRESGQSVFIDDWARSSAAHHEWVKGLLQGAQQERATNTRLAPVLDAPAAAQAVLELLQYEQPAPQVALVDTTIAGSDSGATLDGSPSVVSRRPMNLHVTTSLAPSPSTPIERQRSPGGSSALAASVIDCQRSKREVLRQEGEQAHIVDERAAAHDAVQEKRTLHAFAAFSVHGEINADNLQAALVAFGHARPRTVWIKESSVEAHKGSVAEAAHHGNHLYRDMHEDVDEPLSPFLHTSAQPRHFFDLPDFKKFIAAYERRHFARLQEEFCHAQPDSHGNVSLRNVESALVKLGVSPLPGVVCELASEIVSGNEKETCACGNEFAFDVMSCRKCGQRRVSTATEARERPRTFRSKVDFNLFSQIFDLCEQRAGHTSWGFDCVRKLFHRCSSSSADGNEANAVLKFEGLHSVLKLDHSNCIHNEQEDEELVRQVEEIGANLSFVDFIYLLREHREPGVKRARQVFSRFDTDRSGFLDFKCMPTVFDCLGFITASPSILHDAAELCGISQETISFDDLWRLLGAFNERCGLSSANYAFIRSIFVEYDKDGSGGISPAELRYVMRKIGFPATYEYLQEVSEEFDYDGSGQLEFDELLRMVAKFQEKELRAIRSTFAKLTRGSLVGEEPKRGSRGSRLSIGFALRDFFARNAIEDQHVIQLSELRTVLRNAGYTPSKDQELALVRNLEFGVTQLDFWQVVDLVEQFRVWTREEFQRNQGFTEIQLDTLRHRFGEYDPEKMGFIKHNRVASLLEDLYPNVRTDQNLREHVKKLLNIGGINQKGYLDLPGYIRIMRCHHDRKDYERLQYDLQVLESLDFSRKETIELRQVFAMFDADASGELTVDELADMIAQIVPNLTGRRLDDLRHQMSQVDGDGNRTLNFIEFMRIVRLLQDKDWHGINSKAAMKRGSFGSNMAQFE